jgi:glycosyltransferase involved in cell wall biosynthesis
MNRTTSTVPAEGGRTDPNPPGPFVSVLLMASRHRQFVFEAVDSVHRQTLDPRHYELIVVRDYDDDRLERKLAEVGGRSVRVAPGDIGPAIRVGLDASRGQVLTFLDDDDRYLPNKLAFLYEMFRNDDELGFVRNSYVVIGGEGRPQPRHSFRSDQRRNSARLGRIVLRGADRVAQLRRLPPLGVDFNSSCMSVRRDLAVSFVRNIDLAGFRLLDELAFFASLTSSQAICIDPTILTEYRIHSRNVSMDAGSSPDRIARRADFSRMFLPSYERLVDTVRARGDPPAIEEAEGLLEVQRAYAALRDPSTPRSRLIELRKGIGERRSSYLVKSEARLREALWLFSLAPHLGRWLYSRRVRALET